VSRIKRTRCVAHQVELGTGGPFGRAFALSHAWPPQPACPARRVRTQGIGGQAEMFGLAVDDIELDSARPLIHVRRRYRGRGRVAWRHGGDRPTPTDARR
jgi:hypothetical protein